MHLWAISSLRLKMNWRNYILLYEKDTKQNRNSPMESTLGESHPYICFHFFCFLFWECLIHAWHNVITSEIKRIYFHILWFFKLWKSFVKQVPSSFLNWVFLTPALHTATKKAGFKLKDCCKGALVIKVKSWQNDWWQQEDLGPSAKTIAPKMSKR